MKRIATLIAILSIALVTAFAQTSSKQLEQLQRDLKAAQAARDAQASKADGLQGELRNLGAQENTLIGQVKALNERLTLVAAIRDRQLATVALAQAIGGDWRELVATAAPAR